MASSYYYARAGQRFGPVTATQLRELAASGQLDAEDLIWKPGMANWEAARRIKGLFPEPGKAPPALPAVLPTDEQAPADAPEPEALLVTPAPAETTAWQAQLTAVRPFLDRQSARLAVNLATLIALVAGTACLLLFILSTLLTWESYRATSDVLGSLGDFRESYAGIAYAEGKTACLLAVFAVAFLGVGLFIKRLLPASILFASGAATTAFLLAANYWIRIARYVAGQMQEMEALNRVGGGALGMGFSGGATFGMYLALLTAFAAGCAFLFAGFCKPQRLPFLQHEGVHPLVEKYAALFGTQLLAVLIGIIFFVARY